MENIENLLVNYSLGIESVDFAIYEWLDKDLNIFCNSKEGFKKVPAVWVSPERAFQVKNNKEFRHENGSLNLPIISVERTSIIKDQKNNGLFFSTLPETVDRILVGKRINQKKSAEFANADYNKISSGINFISPKRKNEKIVYKFYNKKAPVYVTLTYSITLTSQFQQQMNEMVQPFISKTGRNRYFTLKKENYFYECFIEPNFLIKNNVNNMDIEERRYTTTIDIKVLANLTSAGENEVDAIIKEYENPVEIKFNKESDIIKGASQENIKQIKSEIINKKVYIIGDGSNKEFTIKHDFNSSNLEIKIQKNNSDYSTVEEKIIFLNDNYIKIQTKQIIEKDSYLVTILG